MSVEQYRYVVGMIEYRHNVKEQCKHELWRQQLQRTISKIRSISGDIQILERSIKNGNMLYSLVGIVCGLVTMAGILGAPFTFDELLGPTALGTGYGLYFGVCCIVLTSNRSSGIHSKCNEASMLLEVSKNNKTEFVDLVKNYHMVQENLCIVKKICHLSLSALGAVVCKVDEALVDSGALSFMLQSEGTNACIKVGVNSCEKVVAPMAGKAAFEIAKKSLRVIGAAAVGISILVEFVEIVQSVKALNQRKFSDTVTTLEKAANEMEDEMKQYDTMFATSTLSVQTVLI